MWAREQRIRRVSSGFAAIFFPSSLTLEDSPFRGLISSELRVWNEVCSGNWKSFQDPVPGMDRHSISAIGRY